MKRQLSSAILLIIIFAALEISPAAQAQSNPPPAPPQRPAIQVPAPSRPLSPSAVITMDEAIELARHNNPELQAQRTLVYQNREQEVTANLRPNPTLSWDAQYIPIFQPDLFSSNYMDTTAQFDMGIGYLFERGQKRQHRLAAAKDATAVTEAQVLDTERTTVAATAQQFVTALLAKSNLDLAEHLLDSYQHTVDAAHERQKAGKMTNADMLKIQLETLQFQNAVTAARIALAQALNTLRELIGFDAVPRNYDIVGQLAYEPVTLTLEELEQRAIASRPDLQAAQRGVTAAQSQIGLAKANSRQDVSVAFDYSHVNAANLSAFFFSIPLPVFNRNQGEVARTYYALAQSQYLEKAAEQTVRTDVKNAYEMLLNNRDILQMYDAGYLEKSQQSLDLEQSAYAQGDASLLDFLDAQRSYRSTQLSYRQGLASYMGALEQLRQAVGTRALQ
jgi:cobalt-zinc-cadmium efflux system outer membrane protein